MTVRQYIELGVVLALSSHDSGGIYSSVPGTSVMVFSDELRSVAKIWKFPKSLIFGTHFESRSTLVAIRVLCMMAGVWMCRWTSPLAMPLKIDTLTTRSRLALSGLRRYL